MGISSAWVLLCGTDPDRAEVTLSITWEVMACHTGHHLASTGVTTAQARPVGELLREWRERRRLSQLDLAIQADISTRHLSFVETGRSKPTSQMILRLSQHLDLPASPTPPASPRSPPCTTNCAPSRPATRSPTST